MRKLFTTGLMLCGLISIVAGCTTYYKVTDPASGKAYYTTKVHDAGRGGAVKIKDEKTGSTVTLQSSEIKEITSEEYEGALKAQAMKATAPMPSTQPQPVPSGQPQPAGK